MLRKLDTMWIGARIRGRKFFEGEKGEVNIVATVVLIGIAVLLAVVFKGQVKDLIENLFIKITTQAGNAVTTAP